MSQTQKQELYRTLWSIANTLRGKIDGWDFKAYVLGILFYRFICENLQDYINNEQKEVGDLDFDYANLSDEEAASAKEEITKIKGFYILPSQLFCNLLKALKTNPQEIENLNITLNDIFKSIEDSTIGLESEENFKGLFDDIRLNASVLGNSTRERNKKLYEVLLAINTFNLRIGESAIDVFGDAYEYLISMYASNAGKSGGEFFTPQEVSRLLALITTCDKEQINKAYDPACGSGSLLLQVLKVLGGDKITQGIFGQEVNVTTYNLCRINMFLHNIPFTRFHIALGDTLIQHKHKSSEPFEVIVSNPPYSTKWEGSDNPVLINDARFSPAGILAPKSKADLAFVMHILSCLAPSGTAAIVEFPGVLYRGGAEEQIRKYLITENFIDCIIQLPENLFFGVSIATCIIVLKKNKNLTQTLFINASEFYTKITNKNKLEESHLEQILHLYQKRETIPHICALIDNHIIAANAYNLSPSSYIEAKDTREKINIRALNAEIQSIVTKQSALRAQIDAIVADLEGIE